MQHQMKLSSEAFHKIARSKKVIESCLYDEKRRQIKIGDEIEFSANNHPRRKIKTRVKELLWYATFEELFSSHEPALFGGESKEALLSEVREFYSEEEEKRWGVVGILIYSFE